MSTENGRRIMMVHIDGDGFASKGEWLNGPYAGKVLLDEIFTHYKIPTSVSVIQGEIAPNGLYPKKSPELEAIAKDIFRLPWVEIASHTYSHPYNWQPKLIDPESPPATKLEDFNLPIPNYKFNLEDEIAGSVNYINQRLAPPHKTCKALFWSGDANPSEQALAMTYKIGVKNLNGGNTSISNYNNSLTQVDSNGLIQGSYLQILAPIQNDFTYTNEWSAPFYGYINVIDAFKLTDSPRRLKPINMYYHIYAGTKLASLNALKKVYDWALAQPVINLFATEFIDIVQDFYSLAIVEKENGWMIRSSGNLREFRIEKTAGYPDLAQSKNVIGYNTHHNDTYIHLGPERESYIKLTPKRTNIPYLVSANARVNRFKRSEKELTLSFQGYPPLKIAMGNMQDCWMEKANKKIEPRSTAHDQFNYELSNGPPYAVRIRCR
jgi:hypothetical protein